MIQPAPLSIDSLRAMHLASAPTLASALDGARDIVRMYTSAGSAYDSHAIQALQNYQALARIARSRGLSSFLFRNPYAFKAI